MSPKHWREFVKPRLAALISAAAKHGLPTCLHSCGCIREIIPDLIEIGLTVLNPVQPECMDPVALKKQYGGQLAFWGTIGTQTTMPFGAPAEVKATVKRMIETVGKGGGLVLAPTHVLEPDVPWENILAFFQAVEEYGRY
jgi:uroporphyrinogen decarboxylase